VYIFIASVNSLILLKVSLFKSGSTLLMLFDIKSIWSENKH